MRSKSKPTSDRAGHRRTCLSLDEDMGETLRPRVSVIVLFTVYEDFQLEDRPSLWTDVRVDRAFGLRSSTIRFQQLP